MAFGDFLAKIDPTTSAGRENILKTGVAGLPGTIFGYTQSKKRKAEAKIAAEKEALRKSIEQTPTYQIPEETQQLLDLYQTQGAKLEDLAGLGQEATNIAKAQTSMVEAPGLGIARDQIQAGTAGTVQNIIEAGGGSASSLEAIAQAGQNELNAMRDLAITNQQYKQQASDEYQQALMNQAGLESSLLGQSTALQAAGLETMIGQKGLVYQSELDKQRTLQQFDITQLGNLMANEEARKARNAQIASAVIGGAADVGKEFVKG
jgi:hypothetical protein